MPAYRFASQSVNRWRRYNEPSDGSWVGFTSRAGRVVFFTNRDRAGAVLPYHVHPPHPTAGHWRTGERAPC